MNHHARTLTRTTMVIAGLFLLSACATGPKTPEAPLDSRLKLSALQADSTLATRAPVEMREAEAAVRAAEVKRPDDEYARHLVLMADQKVEIARARAQSRQYEDQRRALSEQSERARLDARTLEADRAQRDAKSARADALSARADAESAQADAASARDEVAASRAARLELERQITELNARETDRGLVVTLGDLLFATGKSELTGGAGPNLDKLAAFLGEYPDRTVMIEGHTDSVGREESNYFLSQRRADSVKSYLVSRGVQASRLTTAGLGQGSPVASNDTATGRQQNRRVEVIISNVAKVSHAN
jgi:outer membrane protein OmpA-like peptidoglycan-associated protein